PASLIWIEVDLPDILAYKQEILASEHPHCHLELVPLDLADVSARRSMFNTFSDRATKGVVLTEGLLIYLASDAVGILARDLAAAPALQHWIVDIVSPGLLRMLRERTNEKFSETASPLQFGPENGPRFFEAHGWKVEDVQSLLKTAGRLNRLPEAMSQLALLPEDPSCMGTQPWGGVCLLEQARLRSED